MESKRNPPDSRDPSDVEDTAARSLSDTDRKKLSMDSWEPSLLRKLLSAQDRLKKSKR
ncbi:MAG: hypothetical protein HKN84_05005 [Gammaproteobacteria bacterium]|nr:hypothetical protein [Gammaproteobacteria bacterium]